MSFRPEMARAVVTIAALILIALSFAAGKAVAAETAVVEGAVRQRLVLNEALLRSFPRTTVDITFETSNGKSSGRYTGARLWDLLQRAGLVDEPGKNATLRHTLLVIGRDGYAVALALGELDPHYEGKAVILAYEGGEPPVSGTQLRLVVPGDAHGGRSVRDVAAINVR